VIRSLKLCLPIVLMNYLSIGVHVLRIVQLMTGFDRITKDNEHFLRLQLWFYVNDPVTIMIFDTDHKLPICKKDIVIFFNVILSITEFYCRLISFPSVLFCLLQGTALSMMALCTCVGVSFTDSRCS